MPATCKEQVRRQLISESYEQAVEKNSLQVIGEPQFDNPDLIKLPESGPLTYSFEVEVQPEFTIPELKGLKVKQPKVEVTEKNIDQAMQNLREQQGALVPVEDRGVEDGDYLMADVHLKLDGNVVAHQHDAQIVSRPGRIGGVDVVDLDKQLKGLKPGETQIDQGHGAADASERAVPRQGSRNRDRAQGSQEARTGRSERGIPREPRL